MYLGATSAAAPRTKGTSSKDISRILRTFGSLGKVFIPAYVKFLYFTVSDNDSANSLFGLSSRSSRFKLTMCIKKNYQIVCAFELQSQAPGFLNKFRSRIISVCPQIIFAKRLYIWQAREGN